MLPSTSYTEPADDASYLCSLDEAYEAAGVARGQGYSDSQIADFLVRATSWMEDRTSWDIVKKKKTDYFTAWDTMLTLSAQQFAEQQVLPSSLSNIVLTYFNSAGNSAPFTSFVLDAPTPYGACLKLSGDFPVLSSIHTYGVVARYQFDPLPNLTENLQLKSVLLSAIRGLFEQEQGVPGSKAMMDAIDRIRAYDRVRWV